MGGLETRGREGSNEIAPKLYAKERRRGNKGEERTYTDSGGGARGNYAIFKGGKPAREVCFCSTYTTEWEQEAEYMRQGCEQNDEGEGNYEHREQSEHKGTKVRVKRMTIWVRKYKQQRGTENGWRGG